MFGNKAIRTAIIITCLGLTQLGVAADPNLIGWWVFNEGTGEVAHDRSDNGIEAPLLGGPTWETDAEHGTVLVLDGTDDYVEIPGPYELETYTLSLWFRFDGTPGGTGDVVSLYAVSGHKHGVLLELRSNGVMRYLHRAEPMGVSGGTTEYTTDTYDDGAWYHMAAVKTADTMTLYVNGEVALTGSDSTTFEEPVVVVLGTLGGGNNARWFNGALSDFRIYDHAFAASEIASLMPVQPYPQALALTPADDSMVEATALVLQWRPGDFAVSHNVYSGTNREAVANATLDDADLFLGAPLESQLALDSLEPGATYYWRVDAVDESNPDSPWKGEVWSFWVRPAVAWNPSPSDGLRYVLPDQDVSWNAGMNALFHTVYIGENFDEVNDATTGGMMVADATHDPGALKTDTTYYWRVDEFAGTGTIKGDIWSFTTVPEVAVADPTLVGWWTLDEGEGTTAVDWSGHGHHGTIVGTPQWEPDGMDRGALVLNGVNNYVVAEGMMDSGVVLAEYTMAVWFRADRRGGDRELMAAYSDGPTFGAAVEFKPNGAMRFLHRSTTEGTGADLITTETYEDGAWHHVAMVKTADELIGYMDGEVAISALTDDVFDGSFYVALGVLDHLRANARFFPGPLDDARIYDRALDEAEIQQIMRGDPTLAGDPSPVRDTVVDVRDAASLSWSAGDAAVSHNVYLGTDRDATAAAGPDSAEYQGNQPGTSLSLAGLVEFGGGDYYWRIDEVQADGFVAAGNIWKFTVPPYLIVDDFESYNNEVGSRVFETYIDGIGFTQPVETQGNGTGAAVGHDIWTGGFTNLMETANVHGGNQAMPVYYDNTSAPAISEADRTFTPGQNWTAEGVTTLVMHFRGEADNTGNLYIEINGVKVPYDGDPADIAGRPWIAWEIDLASVGVSLTNVTTLTIGIEGGGAGVLYVDDIILTKP